MAWPPTEPFTIPAIRAGTGLGKSSIAPGQLRCPPRGRARTTNAILINGVVAVEITATTPVPSSARS